MRSCQTVGGRAPLRGSAQLATVAAGLASGRSLHAALTAAGYLAAQSSAVHLSGAVSDKDVRAILTARYCATLTDPAFLEMGAERRDRELWLVFAAPAVPPRMSDAALVKRQVLTAVNEARRAGRRCGLHVYAPAAALSPNRALDQAAFTHSREMARHGDFDHRGYDGSSPAERVTRAGYGAHAIVGENIAAGAMTPVEVMQGWLASPAHCQNIMDPRFTEIGIAFAVEPSSAELVYWTEDFAAPASKINP